MSDQAKVFVDYTILSPFGKLSNAAGPFSEKEAKDFITKLKASNPQTLLAVESRLVPTE